MAADPRNTPTTDTADVELPIKTPWMLGLTSLLFILLQSACTAVMAISAVRVIIGLTAHAASDGLNRTASWSLGSYAVVIRMLRVESRIAEEISQCSRCFCTCSSTSGGRFASR